MSNICHEQKKNLESLENSKEEEEEEEIGHKLGDKFLHYYTVGQFASLRGRDSNRCVYNDHKYRRN